jgi:nucleoside-diphosphate-sugar epimerase|tara:strand:+ start:1132 stop:2085 length:954 start_codon:yes stop_codon:yes gene_type:complete
MKILITGGAGYLGSVFTRNLLKNHEVIVYDNLMYNQTSLVDLSNNPNFTFHYGDVREWSKLKYLVEQVDIVIPLAALVGFPLCEKDKDLATSINTTQIQNIVDVLSDDQMILYPNTNSGYGTRGDGMVDETNELTPISHYGQTKCEAEDYIINESNGISFRLATVFGVSSRMRTDLLVNDFVYKLLTDRYITLFEHKFVRNFIHIQDVSRAFEYMIDNYYTFNNEIFNLGLSDENITKKQLVEKIQSHIPDTSVNYSDYYVDPDKRDYIVSNEKIEEAGWKPIFTLDDGIKELIQSYKMIVPTQSQYRNTTPLSYKE